MNGVPRRHPADVHMCEELTVGGPWPTKSDGLLHAVLALPHGALQRFLTYDPNELARVPVGKDIRGLRVYTVRGLPVGTIGGTEFHRIREEFVFGLDGTVDWECEDLYGEKRSFVLTPTRGVFVPPFILHTYTAREAGSGLLVICNTMFDPDDPVLRDTYSSKEFSDFRATNL